MTEKQKMARSGFLESLEKIAQCHNESRGEVQELKEQLKKFDDLYNNLMCSIEESKSKTETRAEDLEVANYLKNQLNDHLVGIKQDFQKLHMGLAAMCSNVDAFTDPVSLLENACKKNEEIIARLKEEAKNKQDFLESQQKETIEKLEKEDASLHEKIVNIEGQLQLLRDLSNKLGEEYEEKVKMNENLAKEIEILEEKIAEKQHQDEAYFKQLFEKQRDLTGQSDYMKYDIENSKPSNLTIENNKVDAKFEKDMSKTKNEDLQTKFSVLDDLTEKKTINYLERELILESQIQLEKRLIEYNRSEYLAFERKNADILKMNHLELEITLRKDKISVSENILQELNKACDDSLENIKRLQISREELNNNYTKLEGTITALTEDLKREFRKSETLTKEKADLLNFELILSINAKLETLQNQSAAEAMMLEMEVENLDNQREELKQKLQDIENEVEVKKLQTSNLKIDNGMELGCEKATQLPSPAEQTQTATKQTAKQAVLTPSPSKQLSLTTVVIDNSDNSIEDQKQTLTKPTQTSTVADQTNKQPFTFARPTSTQPLHKLIVIDSDSSAEGEKQTVSRETPTVTKQPTNQAVLTPSPSKQLSLTTVVIDNIDNSIEDQKQTLTKPTQTPTVADQTNKQPFTFVRPTSTQPLRKLFVIDSDSSVEGGKQTFSRETPTVTKQPTKEEFKIPVSTPSRKRKRIPESNAGKPTRQYVVTPPTQSSITVAIDDTVSSVDGEKQTITISKQSPTISKETPQVTKQTQQKTFLSSTTISNITVVDGVMITEFAKPMQPVSKQTTTIAKQASKTSKINRTQRISKQASTISKETSRISQEMASILKETLTNQVIKQAISNTDSTQAPKGKIHLDDSDSSSSGERMSYAEFLDGKGKMLKEALRNSRQTSTNSKRIPTSTRKINLIDDSDGSCCCKSMTWSEFKARKEAIELQKQKLKSAQESDDQA